MEIPKNIVSNAKLIIFDFDGTIIDLEVNWNRLKEKLRQYVLKEYKHNCSFNPLDENLILMKNKFGQDFYSKLINMVADEEIKGIKKNKARQIIVEFIKKRFSVNMAIFSSNTRAVIEHTLELLQLSHLIGYTVGKEDVAEPKPSPEGLIKIMNFYKVTVKDTLFIGNTDMDQEAGQKAGVTTYLYE